jgi:diaminohydroxyphosphoribosylaminopyrimidine deaminase/5-amino-6-(5-phosphoribosylamino)uracil reductase
MPILEYTDELYMRLALRLAEATLGQTGLNPSVGCVVVKDGRIVGTGAHLRMGGPHAEVHALDAAGPEAAGSTVYVTLEPCSHHGRTPPCCERLVAEKVARVVVAAADPNPRVAGRGIAYLRAAGIQVDVGLLEEEAKALNESFYLHIRSRRPFVTLKSAATLDGRIATRTGDSRWISGPESRTTVHHLRRAHHAVMTGIGTVLQDDPLLTARLDVPGRNPVRIVVDSALRTPLEAKVVADRSAPTWIVCTEQADQERAKRLEAAGVEVIRCGAGPKVDLEQLMARLYEREIGSVLLEAGAALNGAMLERRLVDKVVLFFAPIIVGGGEEAPVWCRFPGFARLAEAVRLERVTIAASGDDCRIVGYPVYGTERLGAGSQADDVRKGGEDHVHRDH